MELNIFSIILISISIWSVNGQTPTVLTVFLEKMWNCLQKYDASTIQEVQKPKEYEILRKAFSTER